MVIAVADIDPSGEEQERFSGAGLLRSQPGPLVFGPIEHGDAMVDSPESKVAT